MCQGNLIPSPVTDFLQEPVLSLWALMNLQQTQLSYFL